MKTISGFSNKKSKGDIYRTPNILTRLLIENLPEYIEFGRVVDPCAGFGDIVKEINKPIGIKPNNIEAKQIDIEPRSPEVSYGDMFDLKIDEDDIVITNPPYSLIDKFLEYYIGANMCLLLPTVYLNVARRTKYFYYLEKLITFNRKLNLSIWRGGEFVDAGGYSFSWFCFAKHKNHYIDFRGVVENINPYICRKKNG